MQSVKLQLCVRVCISVAFQLAVTSDVSVFAVPLASKVAKKYLKGNLACCKY